MSRNGLTSRVTKSGIPVLRVHYSADEHKDPRTEQGQRWLGMIAQGYKGGMNDPLFQKEMEIAYSAMSGQLLFPYWEQERELLTCDPLGLEYVPGVKFYGTYDHGYIHPSVYLVHAVLPDGKKYTVWEFAASMVPVQAIAEIIKGNPVKLEKDGREFKGNPYAGKEIIKICDPHIFERRGSMSDGEFNNVGDVFRDRYGVHFEKGHKGGQLTCASTLLGDLWLDPASPKFQIFRSCKHLIWEIGRLRYQQQSAIQAKNKAAPEKLVDKDDDAWDSLCHFLRRFPSTVAPKDKPKVAGTFLYYQKQMQRRSLANSYARV